MYYGPGPVEKNKSKKQQEKKKKRNSIHKMTSYQCNARYEKHTPPHIIWYTNA